MCRSGPITNRAKSGPTILAARSGSWACSFPGGACICPTCRKLRAISCARSARLALNPEQLLNAKFQRFCELDRERCRRREDAVLDGVDGLSADANPRGEIRLSQRQSLAFFLQPVDEALVHRAARSSN